MEVKRVRILTKHRLVIESYLYTVHVWGAGGEAHTEPGPAQRLHLGRDVDPGPSHHQDLEVALSSLGGVNCVRVRGKYYCQWLQIFLCFTQCFFGNSFLVFKIFHVKLEKSLKNNVSY